MNLFKHKKRADSRPANHLDNTYDFYDRSSLLFAAQVRDILNEWFANYPECEREELKKRLKKEFSPPFFELFLHELFTREGFTLEAHPDIIGTNKKPDFLVKGNGVEFYLEAKESTDKTNEERSVENMKNQLYDSLNTIDSPNFSLKIRILKLKSQNQPSSRKIKRFLENELKKYSPDEIESKIIKHGPESLNKITYEDENIKLVVTLIPLPKKLRGKEDVRTIGVFPIQIFTESVEDSIKNAVEKKATRYGELNKPYLICINSTSEKGLDYEDIMNAFFGSLQVTYSTNPKNKDIHYTRALDGVFLNSFGPMFTRVSAVFITQVYPTNLKVASHWLVTNPFASNELPHDLFRMQKIEVVDNEIKNIEGKSIKEMLGVADDWMRL